MAEYDDFSRSVDDLFGDELIDQESVARVRVSDQPPAGTYTTNPDEYAVSVTQRVMTPKDGSASRKLVGFRGRGEATIQDRVYVHRLEFDLSPDERFALEYQDNQPTGQRLDGQDGRGTKYDLSTRLWKDAVEAYGRTYREAPKTIGQVVEYLKDKPVRIRVYADSRTGELRVGSLKAGGR